MINSIPKKYCLQTKEKTLKKFKFCLKCACIPLPRCKSISDQSSILCMKCYLDQGFCLNNLINTEPEELELLNKLIFSCKNFEKGCQKQFSISSLKEMSFHESKCQSLNKNSKCLRCQVILKKCFPHDCIKDMFKSPLFQDYKQEILKNVEYLIMGENKKLHEKIIYFENMINIISKSNENLIINDSNRYKWKTLNKK